MDTKKLLGLAAASKFVDVIPQRRSRWQRATDPDNLIRLVAYGAGIGLVVLLLKKLYDRLHEPIEEGIERSREVGAAVTEITDAAKATTDAAAEAETNAGKTIAVIEELGQQLADGEEGSSDEASEDAPEKG